MWVFHTRAQTSKCIVYEKLHDLLRVHFFILEHLHVYPFLYIHSYLYMDLIATICDDLYQKKTLTIRP